MKLLLLLILPTLALVSATTERNSFLQRFQCFGREALLQRLAGEKIAEAQCAQMHASTKVSMDPSEFRSPLDIIEELIRDSQAAERVYQGSRAQQGSGDHDSGRWRQQSFDTLRDGPSTRQDYGGNEDNSWTRKDYGGRNRNKERSWTKQNGGFGQRSSREKEGIGKDIEFKASFVFPGDALANIFKLLSGMGKGARGPGAMSFGNPGPMSFEGQGPMSFEGLGPTMSSKSPRFTQFNGGYGSNDGGYAQSLISLIETLKRNKRATGTEMEELVEKLKALRMKELMRRSNFTCTFRLQHMADENMNVDNYDWMQSVDKIPIKDQWLTDRFKMMVPICVKSIDAVPEEHYEGTDRNYAKALMLEECFYDVQSNVCPIFNAKKQLDDLFGSVAEVVDATGIEEAALLELTSKII